MNTKQSYFFSRYSIYPEPLLLIALQKSEFCEGNEQFLSKWAPKKRNFMKWVSKELAKKRISGEYEANNRTRIEKKRKK
jgi:hypothetical protein